MWTEEHELHGYTVHQQYCTLFITNCFLLVWIFIHILHTYPLLQSQYAAIALTTPCTSFTQILLTKRVIFSQTLTLAPWRWFLCKLKHVGAFLSNLECFNNSAFLTLCASVGNKKGSVKNIKFTLSKIFIKIWLSTLKKEEVCLSKTFVWMYVCTKWHLHPRGP